MYLLNLPRTVKRTILFVMDLILIPVAFLLAYSLRYGMPDPAAILARTWQPVLIVTVVGGIGIALLGLQNVKLHALETRAIGRVALFSALLGLISIVASYMFQTGTPRSVPIIFAALFFLLSVGARLAGLSLLTSWRDRSLSRVPVAIYGAGAAGLQLASALSQSTEVRPALFVDDNPAMHGLIVAGLPVRSPDQLARLATTGRIRRVLVAIPSLSKDQRQMILNRLTKLPCEVQVLPSYLELLEKGELEESLRTVAPDELLGRDKVDLDVPDVAKTYAGRVVMVTGAGGSIGSELCRQLLDCSPRSIVLFEHSEFALYQIDRELRQPAHAKGIELIARLGSVTNTNRVRQVMVETGVEVVLHAAAYKHVPLVEENELEGAQNNVIGTRTVAEASVALGVERFILVSTDKAVRPTNVMGATKRMAELVVQDLQQRSSKTKLAMVRFGNVLGSSGSVLPLFQSQIAAGGPVTVTHPEVTRFFMTIPEASRLVLLAGAYAKGGDVFVLDMGASVKIADIARRMIELSGRKVSEVENDGGIEIVFTGLRPGEKLYEELLIDDDSLRATPHDKILRAEEEFLSEIEVQAMLKKLRTALESGEGEGVRTAVRDYVKGYHIQELAVPALPAQP